MKKYHQNGGGFAIKNRGVSLKIEGNGTMLKTRFPPATANHRHFLTSGMRGKYCYSTKVSNTYS